MSVAIKIQNAVKRFGENTIIPDLSLEVREGEFFTLLGSSGCGKTTLLRMMAGFNTIEGGSIYFNDKLMNDIPPSKRNVGMVFQNYAIFPHMSTYKNVAFGLKQRKVSPEELQRRVEQILETVQISELRDRMPKNMSGGQQQRIALARAVVIEPDVLLMDEPLSNLDAKLRVEMRTAIKHIQNQAKITTVYVTHDQEEALAVSDRIAVMRAGVIQQIAAPVSIYQHPVNLFVATFIGQSNVLLGELAENATVRLFDGSIHAVPRLRTDLPLGQKVKLCVRPNEFKFDTAGGMCAVIEERIFFGVSMQYHLRLANDQRVMMTCDVHEAIHQIGETVNLSFNGQVINVFEEETEASLMKDVTVCE